MKRIALLAPVALLALSACGKSTDASEEAMADTVEVPADDAMAGVPDPVVDSSLDAEDAASVEDAVNAATQEAEAAADSAQAAADDAMSAADAATSAADAAAAEIQGATE
tara:strand:- start:9842 stop:10171 length:330 start_codon:yes stop_codon:yes gene_type:complete